MTKREMYEMIATVNAENTEIVEFCAHEIELLDNRKSGKKAPTKTQKANERVMDAIEAILADADEPMTVSQLIADERLRYTDENGEEERYSSQKVSALLRKMVDANRVVKTIEGKKALFAVA